MRSRSIALAGVLALAVTPGQAQERGGTGGIVILGEGIDYLLDAAVSFPLDHVVVEDSSDGKQTTVRVTFRGEVGAGLEARGRSKVVLEKGSYVDSGVTAAGSSEVFLAGGTVSGDLEAIAKGHVVMTDGIISNDLEAEDESRIEMSGGRVGDDLQVEGDARVRITGGEIRDHIEVTGRGQVVLVGYRWNRPSGKVGPRAGKLQGTLADGTEIDVVFYRHNAAEIVLETVPEPAKPLER